MSVRAISTEAKPNLQLRFETSPIYALSESLFPFLIGTWGPFASIKCLTASKGLYEHFPGFHWAQGCHQINTGKKEALCF